MTLMIEDSFGELLKSFRKRRSFSQQKLADLLDVHRNTISIWERGDFLPESKTMVLEIARQLALNDQEARLLLEASLTALSTYWHVPFPRNPFFTGREELLQTLHQGLSAQQTDAHTPSYAICGLGGIGKTHLALEYAYRHALEYTAVFWIEAEHEERIIASFLTIAGLLHLSRGSQTNHQQIVESVQHWLSTHQNWLTIWDNLEDLDLLQHYLPARRSGALLLTTRRQALGTWATPLVIPPLNDEEGITLLQRRIKHQPGPSQKTEAARREKAIELVHLMEGLPLALDQAGAYIEETGCSLQDYLQRYRKHRPQILARRGMDASAHPTSVAVTLQLAVERQHRAAADLLRVCAFLHPEAIPEELFVSGAPHLEAELAAAVADPYQFDLTLAVLRSSSLITRSTETRTLAVHRLVQAVLQDLMKPDEVQHWSTCALRIVNAAFPTVEFENWQQCERYLPHAQACLLHSLQNGHHLSEAGRLFYGAGSYLSECGRYGEAEPFLRQALVIREHQQEHDPIAFAESLDRQATLLWRQGNYEAAEDPFQQALELYKRHLEPGHQTIIGGMNNLAVLYFDQGKYDLAEALYQSIWTSFPWETLGPQALDNIARLFQRQGKYEEAELWYQRALKNWERQPGPPHPDMSSTLNNLATLYMAQGQYEQVEPLLQRSLSLRQQTLGPHHPRTATALHNLAKFYLRMGKDEQAASLTKNALYIYEQQVGATHPDTADCLMTLATLAEHQGNDQQAEQGYHHTLTIFEQSLGPNHTYTARGLTMLANLYRKQRKHEQAEQLYQRALSVFEGTFGSHHPEVASVLNESATLARQQGQYKQAKALYQRALMIRQELLGSGHPNTEETRHSLEQLLQEMKQAEETPTIETVTPDPEQFSSCACGCGRLIDRSKSRGEPRRFFSQACRQRFYRHAQGQKRHTNEEYD